MAVPDVLRSLLTAAGPSGYETRAVEVFRSACEPYAEVTGDTVGSTVARMRGRGEGPTLAVIGHIDEIGLIVSHIDDDGYLWFQPIGGWDAVILVGQRLEVVTRSGSIPGVVGKKPIHLLRDDERNKPTQGRELHIDIGAADADEAREMVSIGDVAVIAAEPVELPNGRVVSRSMDNRLGCYVAYEAMRLLSEDGGAPGDFCAVAVAQEETTFQGAATTAYALQPDVALIVDVTHASDAPGVEAKQVGTRKLGSGPTLERGVSLSPIVFDLLADAAKEEGIEYTVEASGRTTGTDADAVTVSRAGIPTGVLGIPLRYMHSPVEMVQLSDVEATARLVAAFARRLTSDTSFVR